MLIALLLITLACFLIIYRSKKQGNFLQSFSCLSDNLKFNQKFGIYWNIMTIINQLITITVLLLLRDEPSYQVHILLVWSLLFSCLLLYFKPFETKFENRLELFNQSLISISLFFFLISTGIYTDNRIEITEITGFGLISVLSLSLLVNFCIFFYEAVR